MQLNVHERTERSNAAWSLTLQGRYEEALPIYNEVLDDYQSLGEVMNRALVFMRVGDYSVAFQEFLRARSFYPKFRMLSAFPGVALWANGEFDFAVNDWNEELMIFSSDKATHFRDHDVVSICCLLYWGAALQGSNELSRTAKQGLEKIRNVADFPNHSYFLNSLISHLLGQTSIDVVLDSASRDSILSYDRRLMLAHFYAGVRLLSISKKKEYLNEVIVAKNYIEPHSILDPEFHIVDIGCLDIINV